jgi:hypothetical protein
MARLSGLEASYSPSSPAGVLRPFQARKKVNVLELPGLVGLASRSPKMEPYRSAVRLRPVPAPGVPISRPS